MQPDMNRLLGYLAIALLLLVGIVILAVCGEGLCSMCEHGAYTASDRSNPLQGLIRRIRSAFTFTLSFALLLIAFVARGLALTLQSGPPAPVLLRVSSLRI